MRKPIHALLVFLWLVVGAAPLQAEGGHNVDRLLAEAVHAPRHLSFIARIEHVRFDSHATRSVLVRVEHLAPNLTRRSYLAPRRLFGNSTVQVDQHLYEFDVHHRRLIRSLPHDPDDLETIQNFMLLSRNYRAVRGSESTIAGVRAESISLLNRRSGKKRLTIWCDKHTHLIIEKEAFDSEGAIESNMQFETLQYTRSIPPTLFSTEPPAGFSVVANDRPQRPRRSFRETIAEADFKAIEPSILPDGFSLIDASLPEIHGVPMLHLLYSDGIRTLSVFENTKDSAVGFHGYVARGVNVDGHTAKAMTDGADSLLTWRGNGEITFTLVGDLTGQELLTISKMLSRSSDAR
jgi:negative regulator of sigma E activity